MLSIIIICFWFAFCIFIGFGGDKIIKLNIGSGYVGWREVIFMFILCSLVAMAVWTI